MRPKERSAVNKVLIPSLVTLVLTTSAWAVHENVLRSFIAFPHGANPQANLIADAAGNLYGTTVNGGVYGYGAVFRLTPGKNNDWSQTVLYSFTGGSDGGNPVAGLVFDNAGNLYGTTATGGTSEQQCHSLTPKIVAAWFSSLARAHTEPGWKAFSTVSPAILTMGKPRSRV